MNGSSERNEIAVLEWRRITSIAWPTLSLIFALQALFSENPIQRWQILYVTGLLIAGLLSWLFSRIFGLTFSNTPTVLYLLITPLVLENLPERPWMSIGLAAFAAVIYYSTIESLPLAIAITLLITGYQTFVAQMNYKSITDNLDISYFHSYFSILWILIMGVASIFIRRRYMDVAGSIQETVDAEISSSLSRLKSLKQVNEKDSRNLRLHGTVLNTLIHIRNLIERNFPADTSIKTLIQEVESLESEGSTEDTRDFMAKMESMISNRTLQRIDVSIAPFTGKIDSPLVEESCLEIVREIVLNSEKHTKATTAALTFARKIGNEIQITLIDNSVSNLSLKEKYDLVERTKESRTLQNLLVACGATIQISLTRGKGFRKIEVYIPRIDLEEELKSTLAKSRITGLNDFSLNYVRASALVAMLSLPGYLIAGLKLIPLLLTAITVLGLFLILRFPRSRTLLSLLLLTSLLIIPTISQNEVVCEELGPIPWLFNHILTVGFFVSIQIRNRLLKWIPILILSAECFYYPLTYPIQCKNIFLGSLPGIPLIIVLALSVLAVRKREVHFDEGESLEIARLARVISSSDKCREVAYTNLLQDLSKFADMLTKDTGEGLRPEVISLQIQKIQTFLVCAEHFDSELIRKTFELFREKQLENVPGRLILMGENFANIDNEHSIDLIVSGLGKIKADGDASLTIVNVHRLEFHFEGGEVAEKPDSIDGIALFYN